MFLFIYIAKPSQIKHPIHINDTFSYSCTIPIKRSSTGIPCVDILIEDKHYSVEFDLGFKGAISVADKLIEQISSKRLIGSETRTNIIGKTYPINLYSLPKISLGKMTFSQLVMQQDTAEQLQDVYFSDESDKPDSDENQGKLGWEIFSQSTLLIDIKNLSIVISDSLDTMKRQGLSLEEFVKVPFFTKRGLIEVDAKIFHDSLLCVLDTGSTWNIINSEIDDGKSINQALLDPTNITKHSIFKIGKCNFGPVSFRHIPIKTPFKIEAILGVEFFENHVVILDFANGFVYFTDAPKKIEPLK